MLVIPSAGVVGSESKSYIYTRWDTIYSCVKHLLSAFEVPVPGIRKHHCEQNRHRLCLVGITTLMEEEDVMHVPT